MKVIIEPIKAVIQYKLCLIYYWLGAGNKNSSFEASSCPFFLPRYVWEIHYSL